MHDVLARIALDHLRLILARTPYPFGNARRRAAFSRTIGLIATVSVTTREGSAMSNYGNIEAGPRPQAHLRP